MEPYQFEPESDTESQPEPKPSQTRLEVEVSQWCTCGNCERIPSDLECVCCNEMAKVVRRMNQLLVPPTCMVHHPGLEANCLNPYTLQNIHNIYRADYGPLRCRTEEDGGSGTMKFEGPWIIVLIFILIGATNWMQVAPPGAMDNFASLT